MRDDHLHAQHHEHHYVLLSFTSVYPAAQYTPAMTGYHAITRHFPLPAGSLLEGGGQILRNATALAAITGQPIQVSKIRAGKHCSAGIWGPWLGDLQQIL